MHILWNGICIILLFFMRIYILFLFCILICIFFSDCVTFLFCNIFCYISFFYYFYLHRFLKKIYILNITSNEKIIMINHYFIIYIGMHGISVSQQKNKYIRYFKCIFFEMVCVLYYYFFYTDLHYFFILIYYL